MKNNTFVLYADILDQLDGLTREQMGDLFKGILLHVNGQEPESMDGVTRMAYGFIASQIDRDKDKYQERCDKNRENIKKRWNDTNVYERIPNDTTVYDRIRTDTNDSGRIPIDTDSDTDIDSDSEKENKEKKRRFAPPSVDDIRQYEKEKGYKSEAEAIFNFYESKGWMVGKNKMTDWKAAVRGWHTRNKASPVKKNNFTVVEGRNNADKYAALESALLRGG